MPDDVDFADLSKFRKKKEAYTYPFSGIVGQQSMKKALLLLGVNPKIGSLLISGENGIGKMTAAMALGELLPAIEVAEECVSNCDIHDHRRLCIDCSVKSELNSREMRVPFMRLPVGTSEHRIFGGFEKDGTFIPGIMAMANRGFLVVDRANLQDTGLLERILDIQKRGVFELEKDGYKYRHPASFALIATANPAEHEFGPEMKRIFGMAVSVSGIQDVEERIEIVRRVESFREEPLEFIQRSTREQNTLKSAVNNAIQLMKRVEISAKTLKAIDSVLKEVGIGEGDDANNCLAEAAMANAALEDRPWATVEDLSEVVDYVLGHRQ